ncbi:MAG: anti-sigma factor RsbA family regulatory protein [Acidimicrobiales bacterium]
MTGAGGQGAAFEHRALLYKGPEEYVGGIASFVRDGSTAGEPALVAVPGARIDLLRAGLDGSVAGSTFVDMAHLGRNPARIVPAIRAFADAHPGRRTRFVGEPVWPGRLPAETSEVARHEALLDSAFAGTPITILCPYETAELDEAVVTAAALQTHPHLLERGRQRPSACYDPSATLAVGRQALAAPPAHAEALAFHHQDLAGLRRLVTEHAEGGGLAAGRVAELVLAVNEVATNSLVHGGAAGTLRVWWDAWSLVCEVSDRGHIADPLAGRIRPISGALGGRGLWLANQLCDLVELHSGQWGTVVRLHARRD